LGIHVPEEFAPYPSQQEKVVDELMEDPSIEQAGRDGSTHFPSDSLSPGQQVSVSEAVANSAWMEQFGGADTTHFS
jgi:hypothetical protein